MFSLILFAAITMIRRYDILVFNLLGRRVFTNGVNLTKGGRMESLSCFETNIDFEIRFMTDHNLVGCAWVTLPSQKYQIVMEKEMISRCQFEVSFRQSLQYVSKILRKLLEFFKPLS